MGSGLGSGLVYCIMTDWYLPAWLAFHFNRKASDRRPSDYISRPASCTTLCSGDVPFQGMNCAAISPIHPPAADRKSELGARNLLFSCFKPSHV